MAFSFGNSGNNAVVGGAGGVQTGPDLEVIRTEALGFLGVGGETKVQLCSPWPSDNLPPPTASLMSVASHQGLVAAAGPDAIIVARTELVRKAFEEGGKSKLQQFQPQLKIPMSIRVSQLAFSADEAYLVLSAETGGGLAVYETRALLAGSTQSAFQLPTEGQALRALIPNPTADHLFAVVTANGNLMMANLKERSFVSGSNGQVLKDRVSCISWSTKGKQLVAGLADGTVYQMTPEGISKGEIPRPPNVDPTCHVTSITWLENHVFLLAHTPPSSDGLAPPSVFHVLTRKSQAEFSFQKIEEPAGPWGMNRSPPHHFVVRLREFPPDLQDVIITTSTAAVDIGLFTRSRVPLTKDVDASKITGIFTMTEMDSDSERAQLPMSDMDNTSAIGFALDLSSKERVFKPIKNDDEIDESATPLPALMVLNNLGVLSSWWVVYKDSIRQRTIYPSLVVAEGSSQPQASSAQAQIHTSAPAFGGPSTSTTAFGTPSTSNGVFGSRPATSFGTAGGGAFGAPSGLGQRTSPWATSASAPATAVTASAFSSSAVSQASGNASTFGTSAFPKPAVPVPSNAFGSSPATSALNPAFGSSTSSQSTSTPSGLAFGTPSAPAFGSAGLPGLNRVSPWGSAPSSGGSTFGQKSELAKTAGVFGSTTSASASAAPPTGGFSSFASKGGFAAAPPSTSTASIFGSKSPFGSSNAGSAMNTGSQFGSATVKASDKPASLFGTGSFSLGTTFKADSSVKDNEPESTNGSKSSFFGGGFGSALDSTPQVPAVKAPVSHETDMDNVDNGPKPSELAKSDSTTPASTPASAKPSIFGPATSASILFGTPSSSPSPMATKTTTAAGFSFLNAAVETPKPAAVSLGSMTPLKSPAPSAPAILKAPMSPRIKEEPSSPKAFNDRSSEPPLPPDPTSKASYAAGDTSVSSTDIEAPLPPDFIPKSASNSSLDPTPALVKPKTSMPATMNTDLIPPSDVPGGPGDDGDESGFGSDDDDNEREGDDDSEALSEDGSGEDITKDLSPTSEANQTPGFTPQSSFKDQDQASPENTFFQKISKPGLASSGRGLFGEIGGTSAPVLPPPKVHVSPRSPSPIRAAIPGRMLRPDASRSVSAPGVASQILGRQAPASSQSTYKAPQQQKSEAQRREDIRVRKEQEEKQALVDDEDERMQEFLASDLDGTRVLHEFVAHTDYVSPPSRDSIPAQVEAVYRDINAMIDTLGLNARSLNCFLKGHEEQYKDGGRTREDLEEDDDWCLVEIENLSSVVENDLGRDLESGRIKDVADKLETCNDLQKDLVRLRAKFEEVNRIRAAQSDASFEPKSRVQPLSAEQSAQQNDLRRDFTNFQKLLSQAEEGLTILKARIVSQATSNSHSGSTTGPTVEAVMRTITKMTSMAEKRSGDIDVLEGQMRRLGFGSTPRSREGSPFATPHSNRTSVRPASSSTYGMPYTPDRIMDSSRFQSSFMSSTSSRMLTSPPRKKLSGYTVEEKEQIRSKFERKKEVTSRLKESLKKKLGAAVKLMDDDDDE